MKPAPGLALVQQIAAEDRRLAAMNASPARRRDVVVAAVLAASVHVLVLFAPVEMSQPPRPLLPPRPSGVAILRWIPTPGPVEAGWVEGQGPASEAPQPERPPPVRRSPLPDWIFEPVPEPAPPARFGLLPPDAAVLPVPPPSGRSSAPTPREVVRPLLIPESKVEPRFPPVARALRARGTVEIEVRVGVGGSVLEARVVECTRPGVGFEEAALEAVRQWSFRPGRLGYEPVEATTLVRVEFR